MDFTTALGPLAGYLPELGLGLALLLVWALLEARRRRGRAKSWVVIDGSNVMHWRDNSPSLETLREVIAACQKLGFETGVVFDANAGYKLADRYIDDPEFARLLRLPVAQVLVVARGEPADPVILSAARDQGAKIVTNDRYLDWHETFPEAAEPGHLIRGGYRGGVLWLAPRD